MDTVEDVSVLKAAVMEAVKIPINTIPMVIQTNPNILPGTVLGVLSPYLKN